jgi:hypothetical protein
MCWQTCDACEKTWLQTELFDPDALERIDEAIAYISAARSEIEAAA